MDCQYCKKHFATKGSLLTHQKTTKYCLKIQAEQVEPIPVLEREQTVEREQTLEREQTVERELSCENPTDKQPTIEELMNIIAEKDEEIREIKQKAWDYRNLLLNAIDSMKTMTINTVITDFHIITKDEHKSILEKLCPEFDSNYKPE